MKRLLAVVCGLLIPIAASAQVSKQDLLDLAAAGTDPDLMVALIERTCIDFELDAPTLVELTPTVPKAALDAAMACTGANRKPATLECRIHQAMTAQPELADFPVAIKFLRRGRLTMLIPDTDVWTDQHLGDARGFKAQFKAIRAHTNREMTVATEAQRLPGVKEYHADSDPMLSLEELAAMQQEQILSHCSERATVVVISEPDDAWVYVDGKHRGRTPIEIELVPGEREISVEADDYAPYAISLELVGGERREVEAVLTRQAGLKVVSEPPGAVILLGDDFAGQTPAEIVVAEEGEHQLRLIHAGHRPYEETVELITGERFSVNASLEPAAGDACYQAGTSGPVAKAVKQLDDSMRGLDLELRVPLYMVVSSITFRKQPATHVIDGRRLLFEPQMGKRFVDRPEKMLGKDLGGMAFGETAVEIAASPPGRITVTEVESKKNAVAVHFLHENGDKNAIYLDFTKGLDGIAMDDVFEALCLVAERPAA